MPRLLNIGGRGGAVNMVVVDKVSAIVSPNSAPAKRLKDQAREAGRLVDATQGGQTRSLIVTTDNQVFLSNVTVATLAKRFQRGDGAGQTPEDPDSL